YKDMVALLSTDEELQEMIGKWIKKGKYEKILQGWVKGFEIEWRHLYGVGAGSAQGTIPTAPALPRRISLPTYPFARERYWISSSTTKSETNSPEVPYIQTPALGVLH